MATLEFPAKLAPMTAKITASFDTQKFEPPQSDPNYRHRILVVEAKRDHRQLTAEVLMDAGYQVDVAENGAAAWQVLQHSQYDLLIIDQFLPQVSGVELLEKLHAAQMNLPVIMGTVFLPTWEFARYPFLQPVNLLVKPYSFQVLLASVKNVLPATVSAGGDLPADASTTPALQSRLGVG